VTGTSRQLSQADFAELLERHRAWVERGTEASNEGRLVVTDATVSGLELRGATLAAAELIRCRFADVTLEECDLSYSTLLKSVFVDCRFRRCSFVKAELLDTTFESVVFAGSDLTRADLSRADLSGADLTDCKLDWAWLAGTDLRNAVLERVNFEGARLIETKLYNERRFELGSLNRVIAEAIDVGPEGDGSQTAGLDALERLRR
jgi:uncharacterized protein YjbI with pentapeptide repeats